jgi:hypothetical protein
MNDIRTLGFTVSTVFFVVLCLLAHGFGFGYKWAWGAYALMNMSWLLLWLIMSDWDN